jgi:parallel beta-helix repeat protein
MKKIILAALLVPAMALAQTYPSPTFSTLTLQNPLTAANGGTGSSTSTGTGSAVLSNSPILVTPNLGTPSAVTLTNGTGLPISTGVSGLGTGVATGLSNAVTGSGGPVLATSPSITSPTVTGGFTATGLVTAADLATQAANTVLANVTGSTASPAAFSLPSCGTASSALSYTSGTGFACNTAVNAATLSGNAIGTSGSTVPLLSAANTWSGAQTFSSVPTLPSQSANTFLASPAGAAGVPSFRSFASSDLGNSLWVMPQTYGALANSNGTTGNGHDDTAAINSAIAAASAQTNSRSLTGGVVYFPCGIYRITSTMAWSSTTSSIHLVGAGACSQIYNDASTVQSTLTFSGGSCANSVSPCVSVENLNFITPTNPGTAAYAMTFTGVSAPTLKGNIINGYGRGLDLTTSYGPVIFSNTFSNLQGAALICTNDDSCNNSVILANRVYFVGSTISEAAFKFGPGVTTGCINNPDNILFQGNDVEMSYGGPQFFGSCSVSIKDNYIAQNTAFAFNWGSPGYNRAVKIEGNYIAENGGTINGPGPWTQSIANVAGVDFGTNSWYEQGLTWSGLTSMNWSAFQAVTTGASLQNYCNETENCSYVGNGWIREWGTATTSGGSVAVTFPLACPTAGPKEFNISDVNGAATTVWISTSSQTGMTLNATNAATFVSWSITCN